MDLLIEFARTGLGIACVIRDFVADDLKSGLSSKSPPHRPFTRERLSFCLWKKADHPTVFSTLSLILFLSTENSIRFPFHLESIFFHMKRFTLLFYFQGENIVLKFVIKKEAIPLSSDDLSYRYSLEKQKN